MMTGEVIFGGVGSGLYGMLLFVLLAVFIAGLMVGPHARVPRQEDRGARGEAGADRGAGRAARRARGSPALAIATKYGAPSIYNSGPQGFSETLYAYTSQTNNNGSAFAGFTGFVQPNAPGQRRRVRDHVRRPARRRGDALRPLRAAARGAGGGRLAGRQAGRPRRRRHLPHRHADVRRSCLIVVI